MACFTSIFPNSLYSASALGFTSLQNFSLPCIRPSACGGIVSFACARVQVPEQLEQSRNKSLESYAVPGRPTWRMKDLVYQTEARIAQSRISVFVLRQISGGESICLKTVFDN